MTATPKGYSPRALRSSAMPLGQGLQALVFVVGQVDGQAAHAHRS
jgi:hypothetical protein